MPISRMTPDIITAAIEGFESQKHRLDVQIADLRAMLNGAAVVSGAPAAVPARKRRKMSAASRKRIADAQKARWAKFRGESEPVAVSAPKVRRKLSKAVRAKLAANLKKARAAKAAMAKAASPKKTTVSRRKPETAAAKTMTAVAAG